MLAVSEECFSVRVHDQGLHRPVATLWHSSVDDLVSVFLLLLHVSIQSPSKSQYQQG